MADSGADIHVGPSDRGTVKGSALLRKLLTTYLLKEYPKLVSMTKDRGRFTQTSHDEMVRVGRKLVEGVKFHFGKDFIKLGPFTEKERNETMLMMDHVPGPMLLPYPVTVFEYLDINTDRDSADPKAEVIVAEQKDNGNIVLSSFPMMEHAQSGRDYFFVDALSIEIDPTLDVRHIMDFVAVESTSDRSTIEDYLVRAYTDLKAVGFIKQDPRIDISGRENQLSLSVGRFLLTMKILNHFHVEDTPIVLSGATKRRVAAKDLPAYRYHELVLRPSTRRGTATGTSGIEHPYGTRRAHQRRLKSGKVINVRACEINKHKKGQNELRKHYAVGKHT